MMKKRYDTACTFKFANAASPSPVSETRKGTRQGSVHDSAEKASRGVRAWTRHPRKGVTRERNQTRTLLRGRKCPSFGCSNQPEEGAKAAWKPTNTGIELDAP